VARGALLVATLGALVASVDCGPPRRPEIRQGSKSYLFNITSDPIPPHAREDVKYTVTVLDRESGQPTETPTPATEQMQKDVDAIKPDTPIGSAVFAGYVSADFFIQALKKAGANPTPEKVQAAAAKMTFQVKGLIGPTKYPDSHVIPTPQCGALMASDGKAVTVAAPYECSSQTYPVQPKFRS